MFTKRSLLLILMILSMGIANAQSIKSPKTGIEKKRKIDNKNYRVLYQEVVIDKSIKEVWDEVSGNFVNSDRIAQSINESKCLSGNLTQGLGAERYLNINFDESIIEVKERIIDFHESEDHCEFTYEVYESVGSPLTVLTYNTWVVSKGSDGKTYLGTYFIFRAKPGILTGLVGKKIKQSGSIRTGLLTYKHYLETGEKKVAEEDLRKKYPE